VNRKTSLNGAESPANGKGGIPSGTNHLVLNKSQVDGNTASAAPHQRRALSTTVDDPQQVRSERNTAAGGGVVVSGGGTINAQGPPGVAASAILTLNNRQVSNNRVGGIANGVPLGSPMPYPRPSITPRSFGLMIATMPGERADLATL
jgi:hypothetical protein